MYSSFYHKIYREHCEINVSLSSLQNTDNNTNAIDRPPTHYTIKYIETLTGQSCGLWRLSASDCIVGVCRHLFEVSTSRCHPSSDINITVSATNSFGEGQDSVPTIVGKSTPVTCNNNYHVFFQIKTINIDYI